ncbi:MFS transporter [Kushneria indalinina]|uniref:Putative MFS family arabinose efflux permease n=1 Tax=Kushneria indalinina DSM 14324 TaxID=1122140 RepID=A0A3D9DVR1_9GAMM|nr:MFS transporter [Kushneria indalinina]REC94479.1 putative MFS family arabinose efflux permease [Kushneria indalinina DSM 14324]
MRPLTSVSMAILGSGIIAITYGLARFVFGLFLPSIRDEMTILPTMAGVIGALPFLSFVIAIVAAPGITRFLGVRRTAVAATILATAGLVMIALAPSSSVLAAGVLTCGISTGLSSPVMAEAVYRIVPASLRGRVNAITNAGTSVGIAFAMPAVLIWAEAWRSAYIGFAALAALGALGALYYLPGEVRDVDLPQRRAVLSSVAKKQWWSIARLSGLAALMGIASAAYWVFAPDAVMTGGGMASSQAAWMWLAVGLGGLAGGSAGDLIARFGAVVTHAAGLVVIAVALGLLALDPSNFPRALLSAALFGAGYMTLTGFYLVRGTQIMLDTPSLGPIPPLLATSIGQVVGSPLAGWLVGSQGYTTTFTMFAALSLGVSALGIWLLHRYK